MRISLSATFLSLTLFVSFANGASAQDIFASEDFRQDREHWTDPAYYLHNTAAEIRSMGENPGAYGTTGTGVAGSREHSTPYPFATGWEHYQAWLRQADGGTQHTKDSIPDWSGLWTHQRGAFEGGQNPVSSTVALLTPQYQEYFIQDLRAEAQARPWWAGAFCLPAGFMSAMTNVDEFILTPDKVWTLASSVGANYIRWIYTDDSGHSAEELQYPKWHGESIGFWDGDTLIIHTNQVKGWFGGPSEYTDNLETVERYRRVGDAIEGEITLYDPEVFVQPYHAKHNFTRETETRPEFRPLYVTCTDTNGPAQKLYLDENGFLNHRLPGDPLDWDATDPRPWGTFYDESDKRLENYLDAGGTPYWE